MGGSEGITRVHQQPQRVATAASRWSRPSWARPMTAIQRQLAPATQPRIPNAYEQAKAAAAQSINEQVGADPSTAPNWRPSTARRDGPWVHGAKVAKHDCCRPAGSAVPASRDRRRVPVRLEQVCAGHVGGQIDANDNQVRGYYLPLDGVGVQFFRDKPTANTAESLGLARRLQPVSMSAFTNNLRTQLMTGSPPRKTSGLCTSR